MDYDERVQLAAELIDLRVLGWVVPEQLAQKFPPEIADTLPSMTAAHRQALAELYAKHYDKHQLVAELDFYRSEVGQAILEARTRIRADIPEAVNRAFRQFGGTAGVLKRLSQSGEAGKDGDG